MINLALIAIHWVMVMGDNTCVRIHMMYMDIISTGEDGKLQSDKRHDCQYSHILTIISKPSNDNHLQHQQASNIAEALMMRKMAA